MRRHPIHHIELRLLLTCFYIYLSCQTLIYVKQVIFHYSFFTSPFQNPYTYIHIRAIAGGCTSIIFRLLLLYAIWYQMADLSLISIVFLTVLICLRLIFDLHGYYSGHITRSLYYPFPSFPSKSMIEEIIDVTFSLLQNGFGLVLSVYTLIDIINDTRSRRANRELIRRSLL